MHVITLSEDKHQLLMISIRKESPYYFIVGFDGAVSKLNGYRDNDYVHLDCFMMHKWYVYWRPDGHSTAVSLADSDLSTHISVIDEMLLLVRTDAVYIIF